MGTTYATYLYAFFEICKEMTDHIYNLEATINDLDAEMTLLITLNEVNDSSLQLVSKGYLRLLRFMAQDATILNEKISPLLTKLLAIIGIYSRANSVKSSYFDEVIATLAMIIWYCLVKGSTSALNGLFKPVTPKDIDRDSVECRFSQCWHSIAKYEIDVMPLADIKSFANMAFVNGVLLENSYLSYSFLKFVLEEYPQALEFAEYLKLEFNRIESSEMLSKFAMILDYVCSSLPKCELLGILTLDMAQTYLNSMKSSSVSPFKKLEQKIAGEIFLGLTPIIPHVIEDAPTDLKRFPIPGKKQVNCEDESPCFLAFGFLLEVIDQHENLNYTLNSTLVENLLMALCILNKYLGENGKLFFFQQFNKLNFKISLTVSLLSYNYLIQRSILKYTGSDDVIPEIIINNFQFLKLPPLSKSELLCDRAVDYEGLGNDMKLIQEHVTFTNLLFCLILNLNVLTKIIEDEFNALCKMSNYASSDINEKLVFNLLDLTCSSLFSVLVVFLKVDNQYLSQSGTKMIYAVFNIILNISIPVEASLIWVNFLNFAHDVCYSDIRFYQVFKHLLAFLIQKAENIGDDPLIRSGLESFVLTFTDGEPNDPLCELLTISHDASSTKQISLQDFSYLYLQKSPTEEQNKDTNLEVRLSGKSAPGNSGAVNKSYLVNSARQPSVHIDQFGK